MGKICKCCRVGGKVKLKKVWFLFKFKMVFRVVFFCFGVGGKRFKECYWWSCLLFIFVFVGGGSDSFLIFGFGSIGVFGEMEEDVI